MLAKVKTFFWLDLTLCSSLFRFICQMSNYLWKLKTIFFGPLRLAVALFSLPGSGTKQAFL